MRALAVVLVLFFFGGEGITPAPAQSQGNFVVDYSCAHWLEYGDVARRNYGDWWQVGYAAGVMSSVNEIIKDRKASAIQTVGELQTGITSVCAGTPQKRLIDVALYLLGAR